MHISHYNEALHRIKAGSPYLTGLLQHREAFASRILNEPPKILLDEICTDLFHPENMAAHLRQKKSEVALLVAMADLGGEWDVVEVTHALTIFADACVRAAVDHLLRDAAARGKLTLQDAHQPSQRCGYVILAMGKHGAFELNYSSDIDLIVLYDPETARLASGVEPSTFFVKLTRALVSLLQDITEDGYVFRVDLRLRPDPRATQMAISLEAAAIYYENQGQNWERAAMIKARAVAGDIALGEEFLRRLTSYIWRKYLDYAAIADVQSLKRQIHAVKGHGEIAVLGHNLKLGRGGIREIEFFVQTQQLIAGGRNADLRGRRTLDTLNALADANWIAPATAEDMKSAYGFLRTLEHRAQMVDDQQTHIVPSQPQAFERYARFCGFENGKALSVKLRETLETVQEHYAALFENAGALAADGGSLVFTGGEDDPATIETLEGMGFLQASEVSATIRGWHFGRYVATRTARTREILTELMPVLLKALAQTGEPDQSFLAFDSFLKGLPSGVQFFSMVKANPGLLDLITQILSAAPRLAAQLSHQPRTLEAVVSPDFFGAMPDAGKLARDINAVILDDTPRDEAMDRARVLGREQMFKVGVRVLSDTLGAEAAGQAYTLIADALLLKLLAVTETEMRATHGEVAGGQCAIIAMGKLGSREMTATSDLDLILVYDHEETAELSSGPKPISVTQYYARLTQRFVTAITAPTAEGTLYEVDLRLRPSGSKGPVAVGFSSFRQYQMNEAWTWERMALTRARVITADEGLQEKIESAISTTLQTPRDSGVMRKDVADMRALMLKEHAPASIWDIKRSRGGLIEIEFIAQFLQLKHAASSRDILDTNTTAVLRKAENLGMLKPEEARTVLDAIDLYQRLTQILRLCVSALYDPASAARNLNRAVCRAARMPDITSTEALLSDTEHQVSDVFEQMIGRP